MCRGKNGCETDRICSAGKRIWEGNCGTGIRKMKSELLLFGYGIVCLCMLVFNVFYNIALKQNDRRMVRKTLWIREKISGQMARIAAGGKVEEAHMAYLKHYLSHVGNLIAFDHALEEYFPSDEKQILDDYRRQIQPLFIHLALVYRKRSNMQAAYFAHFLSKHNQKQQMSLDRVQDILVEYMKKESLYCRVNALQALYNSGSAESVAKAVTLLDKEGCYIHEKILTDGLLTFTGSHEKLAGLLWERLLAFTNKTQISVLNYIRYETEDYCEGMFSIMTDMKKDKELRLSAIRYFGRYFYAPAKEALSSFAADKNPLNWEYAAVSASSLSKYPGEEVTEILTNMMHSPNWYVRYNAAVSLGVLGLDYRILAQTIGGEDRYAREMLLYQMDEQYMKKEKALA